MRTSNTGCGIAIVIFTVLGIIGYALQSVFTNIFNVIILIIGLILIFSFPKVFNMIMKMMKDKENNNTDGPIIKLDNYKFSSGNTKQIKEKTKMAYQKIIDINTKINKLVEYVELLKGDSEDNDIAEIIEKQNETVKYLSVYYDKYASIFLWLYLKLETEKYKNINIKNTDIKEYILSLTNNIDKVISFIKEFPFYSKIEHIEINKTIERVNETIKKIKISLVACQSNMILNNISPIEDDFNVNNKDDNNILIEVDDLTNQYERFIQEINITHNNF